LFEKFKGKSVEELVLEFTPESAKDAMAKNKDVRLQMERSGRPEPAESVAATLNCPLKDVHSTLKTNDASSPLSGSLEVVPVQGNSGYIALSYVWGNEGQKFPFILNGHKVEITENWRLLSRIFNLWTRLSISGLMQKLLHTVDDVSNRESISNTIILFGLHKSRGQNEKSEQVRKMKTIYENASLVLVWLCPASNDSDLIMDSAIENGPGYVEEGGYFTANTTILPILRKEESQRHPHDSRNYRN
jgi:hypothetical protein